MKSKRNDILLHAILICISGFTLLPFAFVLNNSLRTNSEMNHAFFGLPATLKSAAAFTWFRITGQADRIKLRPTNDVAATPASPPLGDAGTGDARVAATKMSYGGAMRQLWSTA